ncbi:MAG: fibronectin type III domain-containing protein, partial [Candidatus Omnitrophica bacterium]|nr:fibronectin type III domain-containing protein [Candidatus Omnitrophota bacterium]
ATNENNLTSSAATTTATPLGAPGQIDDLGAESGDKQVDLTWTQPDLNGSGDITSYTVTVRDPSGTVVQTIVIGDDEPLATSTTVIGLTNGVTYTFEVTATNENNLTSSAATTTATPLGAPLQVTGLQATPGDRQASLSWNEADENNSGDISYYTITITGSDGVPVDPVQVTAPADETIITGLTSGVEYEFTITATNEHGLTSIPSTPATATPFGPPNAVTGLGATPGDKQIDLEWTEPVPNAGGAIASYTITVTDPNGNVVQTITINAPADEANIDGLNNGVEYTFTITATNVNGVTGDAATITAIPATVPLPPVLDTADRGDQSVALSWTPQFDQGSAITQ